jgi:hypothetical protein
MSEDELLGPFAEARAWLLRYFQTARVENEILSLPLAEDWSAYDKARAAYVLGVIWGRLRQIDGNLETATEYAACVEAGLAEEEE